MVGVVAFALFVDYFVYGAVIPLTPNAPANASTDEQLAFLYLAYATSVLVVTPAFGYLGDRLGARVMMLVGVAFAAAGTLFYGLGDSFAVLTAARLCQGASSAAVWTSGLALVAENYPERRVEMIGYAFTGSTLGLVLGPVMGGAIYRLAGYQAPFLVIGAMVAIEAVALLLVLPSGRGDTGHVKIDFRRLLMNRQLLAAAFAVALAAFGWGILEPLLPVHLQRLGVSAETVGILFTVSAILYGLSAPLVGWASRRMSVKSVTVLGTVLMALLLPAISAFDSLAYVAVVLCLVNVSYAFMLNPAAAELANASEAVGLRCYSTVYAVYNITYSIGMLVTSSVAAGAAQVLGFRGALFCVSGILLVSIAVLVAAARGGTHVQES